MSKEEYDLMWELIEKAFENGNGLDCDFDEVGYLIPSWDAIESSLAPKTSL